MRMIRTTNGPLSLRPVMSRTLITAVASVMRGVTVVALALTSAPSTAQFNNCVSSSFIPGYTPLLLRHPDGRFIHLRADSRNFQRGAHLWVNGTYENFYPIPFHVYSPNDVRVTLRQGFRNEIFLGAVRSPVIGQTPIVIACNGWFGNLR
jgi:hypothetical protein